MLDPRRVRDHFQAVRDGLAKRGPGPLEILNYYVQADDTWRKSLQEVEQLLAKRNALTPKGKPTSEQLAALKSLSDEIKLKQDELAPLEYDATQAALTLPNVPHESVPIGQNEDQNVEVRRVGDIPTFTFTPKAHEEVGGALDLFDFERAAKITGARFVIYKNWGAKVERALINFMLDFHSREHGYSEIMPPALVNTASLLGTGQLPKFEEDQFQISQTDFWLSPTAEVQVTNMLRDEIIPEDSLPLQFAAYAPCFRKEAGSYGRDMTGLIRHHQFNKVELVHFSHPDHSMATLERLLGHAEAILKALGLPYRVVTLCAGDMGFSAAKTYDIEVWFPAQGKYREISSCSNFLDFQARRAMIRFRAKDGGKVQYLHTLNGSGLAVGRTFAALLENFQKADGSVAVPSVLIPYLGVDTLR